MGRYRVDKESLKDGFTHLGRIQRNRTNAIKGARELSSKLLSGNWIVRVWDLDSMKIIWESWPRIGK